MAFTHRTLWLLLVAIAAGCAGGAPPANDEGATRVTEWTEDHEAISLLGEELRAPVLPEERRIELERQLDEARAAYERDPTDADAIIWLGRRTAYLGRYREAIAIFTEGIAKHPGDARMYRHRGHRLITVRAFDAAIADLERAAALVRGKPDEIEPDGMPNAYGLPTSTLQSNIWYHLGLAYYLTGEFEQALEAFRACMEVATNPDMHVAAADWLYMTLRRLGRDAEAAAVLEPITADMQILENHAYHRLLLMYKGELPPDSLLADDGDSLQMATQGYGVGNWYLYNGDPERAREIFERVVSLGNWPAFGHIAAEAELARMRGTATAAGRSAAMATVPRSRPKGRS